MELGYDLILPIGERCHTVDCMNQLGYVKHTNIFDWLGGVSLDIVCDALASGFKNFLMRDNLIYVPERMADEDHHFFYDKTNEVRCAHFFKNNLPADMSVEKHYPLLERLKKQTMNRISVSRNILMVHATNEFSYTVQEILVFSRKIEEILPNKKIDFFFFTYIEAGRPSLIFSNENITIYKLEREGIDGFNLSMMKSIFAQWAMERRNLVEYKGQC